MALLQLMRLGLCDKYHFHPFVNFTEPDITDFVLFQVSDSDVNTVICDLEQCLTSLQQKCRPGTLSEVNKNRLQQISLKLHSLIDQS
jgi:hypothetical protein